jgi:hypothetical protein
VSGRGGEKRGATMAVCTFYSNTVGWGTDGGGHHVAAKSGGGGGSGDREEATARQRPVGSGPTAVGSGRRRVRV